MIPTRNLVEVIGSPLVAATGSWRDDALITDPVLVCGVPVGTQYVSRNRPAVTIVWAIARRVAVVLTTACAGAVAATGRRPDGQRGASGEVSSLAYGDDGGAVRRQGLLCTRRRERSQPYDGTLPDERPRLAAVRHRHAAVDRHRRRGARPA